MSSLLMGERFVAAYPNLIRALKGDVIAALVLQAINYRSNITKPDIDGEIWVDLRIPEIADEIGISSSATQRALQRLRDKNLILEIQAKGYNNIKLWSINEIGLDDLENSISDIRERITKNAPANNYKFDSEDSSISKEVNNNIRTSRTYGDEVIALSNLFADLIEANGIKRPTVTNKWNQEIERLNRIDGYSWQQIEATIRWVQNDSFWRSNVLSPSKLRKQFGALQLKMKSTGGLSGWARVIAKFENEQKELGQ